MISVKILFLNYNELGQLPTFESASYPSAKSEIMDPSTEKNPDETAIQENPGAELSEPITQNARPVEGANRDVLQDLNRATPALVLVGDPRDNVPAPPADGEDSDEENRVVILAGTGGADNLHAEGEHDEEIDNEEGGQQQGNRPGPRQRYNSKSLHDFKCVSPSNTQVSFRLPNATTEYIENHGRRTQIARQRGQALIEWVSIYPMTPRHLIKTDINL